jgi:molecular chaperone DnaK
MGKVIGIDLGTTNSVAAYVEAKNPEVVLTPEGDRLLPSLVAFSKTGERLVGNPAKSQLITNPNTIYSVKRLVGKRYSEVSPYLEEFSYPIVEGEDDTLKIKVNDVLFSSEEISAMILEKLKEAAEERLDDVVDGAIITVPAYFNDSQRQATKDAGEISGLNVLRIINEPTAASLAFSLDLSKKLSVLVYDFGGGTTDISVLDVQNDVIKVLATAGDIKLGGNDIDILLAKQLVEEIKREHNVDLSGDKMAMQRIRDAAENTKKELSSVEECEVNLPFITETDEGPVHFLRYYTRKEFEDLITPMVDRTIEICSRALNNADRTVDEINEILLVGGSTRIPCVQKRIREFFHKDPNKKVNPDEIVAMGAAIQGAIATGESRDILLLDVIPISLGVKTFGGSFTRIIDANTTLPTNRSLVFSTVEDNQTEVEIIVFQGEREIAEENKLLGKFTLTGIGKAAKGLARIEVMFSVDINGILTVTAIDLSSKSKKRVVVSNSGLLSEDEIKKIKKTAEKYKESDLKKRVLIDVKNEIYNYVYTIKKYLESSELDDNMKSVANGVIRAASDAIEHEVEEELEDVRGQLVDLNIQLSRLVTQPIEVPTTAPAPDQVFKPPEPPPKPKKDITAPIDAAKELKEIKQKILHSVYNIEQYISNLELDKDLTAECNLMISRANAELDSENLGQLETINEQLEMLNKKLDSVVSASLGFEDREKEKKPPDKKKKDKDDTQPFRVFKG